MKYALIGEKLGHSYSCIVHKKYFKYMKLPYTYELIEIPKSDFVKDVKKLIDSDYKGFNITIPYKLDILSLCTCLSGEVENIGAANTCKISHDMIYAYNTDYMGLKLSCEVNNINLNNKKAVILGTGGASKAVQVLCRDLNCSDITLVSRTPVSSFDIRVVSYDNIPPADVVFNTTPVGMFPKCDASPIDDLTKFEAAVDLIYNPSETVFMKKARQCGLKTVGGLYMLVAQALYSQAIWHDSEPDINLINKIYNEMRDELK